jgi:hypothetical protein
VSALDLYDKDGNAISRDEYIALLEQPDYKRVAKDVLPNGRVVSTVWLGLDHSWGDDSPPLIFETMVFPSEDDFAEMWCERYTTLALAQEGHARLVLVASNSEWTFDE